MSSVLIVGSGPSGVHLAQTVLSRGHLVTMLDVGNGKPEPLLPDADFDELKDKLEDPVQYFLGDRAEGVVLPSRQAGYYTHPPSKSYVFAAPDGFGVDTDGFQPVISFASGGLAEAWTGGSYPLNDAELGDFPFAASTLAPYYAEVIRRIGVTAEQDDIGTFSSWFEEYSRPLALDGHSRKLLDNYLARRAWLNEQLGFHLGRSRVAVLSSDLGDRKACDRLGRCLWGCPRNSIYAPSSTLRHLQQHPNFRYLPHTRVMHHTFEGEAVTGLVARDGQGEEKHFRADIYVLAAGALCSSKLHLDSIYRRTGEVHSLGGLMDNRQIMVPFLSPSLLGRPSTTHGYQFHQLALAIARSRPEELIHGQITALKSVAVHPIAQNLPLDLRSALAVFRQSHAALGVANVWLHDRRRPSNMLTIKPRGDGQETDLVLRYSADDAKQVESAISLTRRGLRTMGCVVPSSMIRVLGSGASVHYAGLLPMQDAAGRFATTAHCRSHEFRNLYFADGATFPFLPAKNLTFTLMANAIRVGEHISAKLADC